MDSIMLQESTHPIQMETTPTDVNFEGNNGMSTAAMRLVGISATATRLDDNRISTAENRLDRISAAPTRLVDFIIGRNSVEGADGNPSVDRDLTCNNEKEGSGSIIQSLPGSVELQGNIKRNITSSTHFIRKVSLVEITRWQQGL